MPNLFTKNSAAVILAAIAATVLVWQWTVGDDIAMRAFYAFGVIPAIVGDRAAISGELGFLFAPLRLLTAQFFHDRSVTFAANVAALTVFGTTVQTASDMQRAVLIYLVGGFFAAMVVCVALPTSTHPFLGLQGATAAMFGAAWVLHGTSNPLPQYLLESIDRRRIAFGYLAWLSLNLLLDSPPRDYVQTLLIAYTTTVIVGAVLALLLKRESWQLG